MEKTFTNIPLSVPNIGDKELLYVKDCIDTNWISSSGSYVNHFEELVAKYTKSKFAVSCINGTSGLHISLVALNIPSNSYVITTNLTFVATLNAIKYIGAEPILFDVEEDTFQIDVNLIKEWLKNETYLKIIDGIKYTFTKTNNKHISAIIPVHVLGNMCDMEQIIELSDKYGIKVIEDSTEALGSFLNNKHSGTFGDIGVFSFNGNKIISTGGGGMIVTDDEVLFKKIKHLTTTAKIDSDQYYHDEIGYNYRLVNVLAAIGVAQMERFQDILIRKKEIYNNYLNALNNLNDISFPKIISKSSSNNWLITIRTKYKKELFKYLKTRNIESRSFWIPMNNLPMFKELSYINKSDISNKIYEECLSIPCSSNLSNEDQIRVINTIINFFKNGES